MKSVSFMLRKQFLLGKNVRLQRWESTKWNGVDSINSPVPPVSPLAIPIYPDSRDGPINSNCTCGWCCCCAVRRLCEIGGNASWWAVTAMLHLGLNPDNSHPYPDLYPSLSSSSPVPQLFFPHFHTHHKSPTATRQNLKIKCKNTWGKLYLHIFSCTFPRGIGTRRKPDKLLVQLHNLFKLILKKN